MINLFTWNCLGRVRTVHVGMNLSICTDFQDMHDLNVGTFTYFCTLTEDVIIFQEMKSQYLLKD